MLLVLLLVFVISVVVECALNVADVVVVGDANYVASCVVAAVTIGVVECVDSVALRCCCWCSCFLFL